MLYLQYLLGERERVVEGKEDVHSCDSVCALVVDDAAAVSPINGDDSPPSQIQQSGSPFPLLSTSLTNGGCPVVNL